METTRESGAGRGAMDDAAMSAERGTSRGRLRRPHLSGDTNVAGVERVLSVLGGGALALYGLRQRGAVGVLAALGGAALMQRGATGHCPLFESLGLSTAEGSERRLVRQHGRSAVLEAAHAIRVEHAVTIRRPREELFRYWRDLENLPRIMRHLESVTVLDDRRSRWRVRAPAGQHVEWDAIIHNEIENELIAWKSLDDASVANAGSVHFTPTLDARGTEVRVLLEYDPPAGRVGTVIARLFGEEPGAQVRDDLERFRRSLEREVADRAPTPPRD